MYKFFIVCVCLLVGAALGTPIKDALMFGGRDDTATVESTVREARAAPSQIGDLLKPGVKDAYLYVFGDAENDDGDLHGYSKKMNDKGKDGYRHFDSFHKKDGDKYGYEKHAAFGQENKAGIDIENEKGIEAAHSEAGGGKKDKKGDVGEESRKSYAVFEGFEEDDKKQPKKKIEGDYGYYGDGDGGGYESSEGDDGGSESAESESEGDDGDGEGGSYDESEGSEESEEGGEESEY